MDGKGRVKTNIRKTDRSGGGGGGWGEAGWVGTDLSRGGGRIVFRGLE